MQLALLQLPIYLKILLPAAYLTFLMKKLNICLVSYAVAIIVAISIRATMQATTEHMFISYAVAIILETIIRATRRQREHMFIFNMQLRSLLPLLLGRPSDKNQTIRLDSKFTKLLLNFIVTFLCIIIELKVLCNFV